MYTKKLIVVLNKILKTTDKQKKDISDFAYANEKKEQAFEIVIDDHMDLIEEIESYVDLRMKEVEIGETLSIEFITSSTTRIYSDLKKRGLLYKSLGKISSKMKKVENLREIDVVTEEVTRTIRKKKETQSKPNYFFAKLNFGYHQSSFSFK